MDFKKSSKLFKNFYIFAAVCNLGRFMIKSITEKQYKVSIIE